MKQVDTIILVKDVIKSRDFYQKNFNLEILHDWESMIIFKNRLALHQTNLLQPKSFTDKINILENKINNLIIYIELESNETLENILLKLQKNEVKIVHGIYQLPWQRIIRILDPDNNIIEIGEPSIY